MRSLSLRQAVGVAALFACQPAMYAHESWPLWDAFVTRFVDAGGRVVDHDASERTTSEGQSYSLFFALVANDRPRFDQILRWTESNLAAGDLTARLPAWLWGRGPDGDWRILDKNPASDADLWLAYSLIQAGRLWNSPEYSRTGLQLARRIAAEEVKDIPGFGPMLLPGIEGFHPSRDVYILNASYLPPQLVWNLAAHVPDGPWSDIAMRVPDLIRGSSPHGWVLDWIAYKSGSGFGTAHLSPQQAKASYDAIRVYLWAGMQNHATYLRSEVLSSLRSGMLSHLEEYGKPPAEISPTGKILAAQGNVGFAAALMPLLESFGETELLLQQQRRLDSERVSETGLFGRDARYYDQCLALFSTGWNERRFSFDPYGNLNVGWINQIKSSEDER